MSPYWKTWLKRLLQTLGVAMLPYLIDALTYAAGLPHLPPALKPVLSLLAVLLRQLPSGHDISAEPKPKPSPYS